MISEPVAQFPLGRLTTVGTGGAAEFFARAGSGAALDELLAWAVARALAVNVIGSGSNVLVADAGVRGLVLKLDRDLARIEPRETRIRCGAGARLPAVAARAAALGLGGIEFGVNIPGTVGGAVRMNANAYGGELARVLAWVEVHTAAGSERRVADQLGLSYRASNLGPEEIVARAEFVLEPEPTDAVRARLADLRARRHAAQPKGIRTFGSTFKNPPGQTAGLLLASAGAAGLRVGGARFSPKHANFVENTGTATTADVVRLMAEGRRLVRDRCGIDLEPEVQTLGPVDFPWTA
jgi:UDP-N-acetylenolpyruvoylglucosamine reductase